MVADPTASAWRTNPNLYTPALIANGNQSSGVVDLGNDSLCGIMMPSAFTGTSVSFEMSDAVDGTFVPIKNAAGSAVNAVVAADTYVVLDPTQFIGIRFLKVKSGSTELAARTLQLAIRALN